jgi:hypothetical protein
MRYAYGKFDEHTLFFIIAETCGDAYLFMTFLILRKTTWFQSKSNQLGWWFILTTSVVALRLVNFLVNDWLDGLLRGAV